MWSQKDGRLSTITKVKVLSPETIQLHWARGYIFYEASIAACVKGECISNMPGSEAMVGNRIVCTGTWESHITPCKASNEQKMRRRKYGDMAVGLIHIRGVDGVMPIESPSSLKGISGKMQRDEEAYAIH